LKNMENLPPRLSFSDEFRSCVLNNFNARHKVLSEQHDSVQPGSAEERILHMYEMAAIELPERETKDPAQVTADSVRRSFHVPELGLRR
jgi:DNA-directed RNA polymerase subunit H (RpoH/RPB5)